MRRRRNRPIRRSSGSSHGGSRTSGSTWSGEIPPRRCARAPQRRLEIDDVAKDRSPLAIVEKLMTMIPAGKRPGDLTIGEEVRGGIFDMFGDPAKWDRAELLSLIRHERRF